MIALALAALNAHAQPTTDVEELHAFAKLYGYVRWFHPSDEAARVDWDAFAVEGVRRVVAVEDRDALAAELEAWFRPVAPTLDVHGAGEPPRGVELPRGKVVAWQHEGYGDSGGVYQSHRTARVREVFGDGADWATLVRSVPAEALRGRDMRLTVRIRVEQRRPSDEAAAWLRVDRAGEAMGFFDNMNGRRVRSAEWTEAVIEGPVADDAERVVFGGLVFGRGAVEYDDFTLSVRGDDGAWQPVPFENASFEAGLDGWNGATPGFRYAPDGVARIEREVETVRRDLFPEHAALGDAWTGDLGAGLQAWVPLALPSRKGATWRPDDAPPPPALPKPGTADDPAVRLAGVVVAWNVPRHFYPYLDVVGEDWDAVLDEALADALDDEGPDDHVRTLRRLIARMHDGHAQVFGAVAMAARPPVRLARAEGRVVVALPVGGLVRGDVVTTVDGVPVEEALAAQAAFVSGSPQWIEHRLLADARLLDGEAGSTVSLGVVRGEEALTVELVREEGRAAAEFDRPAIAELDGGVWYVDLDRASWDDIEAQLPAIAAAPGVVFDLRGYPNGNHDVLAHLLTERDDTKWMFVARMLRPDQTSPTWRDYGWGLRPLEPHVGGKVAWLTGPGAISYAESVMGFVEHFDLGTIVGGPTAGANGNVAVFSMPGGYQATFTGMKVLRADGRQQHVVGVQPDVAVERTVAGIRDGRDEVLERALEIVAP